MTRLSLCLIALLGAPGVFAQPDVTSWNILKDGYHEKFIDARRDALIAVGSIGETPQVVELLTGFLHDENLEMRQTAAAVMDQMKCRLCIPVLKTALDDPSGEVAFAVAKALWDMGDRSGRELLEEVLTGETKSGPGAFEAIRRKARTTVHDKKAMVLIGAKETTSILLGPASLGITAGEMALKDGQGGGRTLSATLLGEDCDARELDILERELDNEKNWAVRAALERSIGKCGNPDAIPILEQRLSESNRLVRYMAAASIVRLSARH